MENFEATIFDFIVAALACLFSEENPSPPETVVMKEVAPSADDTAATTQAEFDHWFVVMMAIIASVFGCANFVFFVHFQLSIHRNVLECRRRLSGELPFPMALCCCRSAEEIVGKINHVDTTEEPAEKMTKVTGKLITDQLAKITQDLPEVKPREAAMRGFYLARVLRLLPPVESFAICSVGELLRRMAGIRESESKPRVKPRAVVQLDGSCQKSDCGRAKPRSGGIRRSGVIVLTPERLCELRKRYGMANSHSNTIRCQTPADTTQLKGGSDLILTSLSEWHQGGCTCGWESRSCDHRRRQFGCVGGADDVTSDDVICRRITVLNVVVTGTAWWRHCAKWTCLCGSAQLYNERALLGILVFREKPCK